jgi:hypothetical protein
VATKRQGIKATDLNELQRSITFMRGKLAESRKAMEDMPIVLPDAAGDVKKNAAYVAYVELDREYRAALKLMHELTSEAKAREGRGSKPAASPLMVMRGRFDKTGAA